jgi:hypothetical protein
MRAPSILVLGLGFTFVFPNQACCLKAAICDEHAMMAVCIKKGDLRHAVRERQ